LLSKLQNCRQRQLTKLICSLEDVHHRGVATAIFKVILGSAALVNRQLFYM